jgi:hypothetical protein
LTIVLWQPRHSSNPDRLVAKGSGEAAALWHWVQRLLATGGWIVSNRIPAVFEPCGLWHEAQSAFATG